MVDNKYCTNVRGEHLDAEFICSVAIPSWDEPECNLPYNSTGPESAPATNQNKPECDLNCENISPIPAVTIVTLVYSYFHWSCCSYCHSSFNTSKTKIKVEIFSKESYNSIVSSKYLLGDNQ